MNEEEILERHEQTLSGKLRSMRIISDALGIGKPFYVYEPPGFGLDEKVTPLVYLFRGHQREHVNLVEDDSRKTSTTIERIDQLILAGILPPMLIVLPGLNSANNHIPSLGINMVGKFDQSLAGLGTGQFWDFLNTELFPYVLDSYPTTQKGIKIVAGFSLGGYTASLIATQKPGYFHHVGIYDGTVMYANHINNSIDEKRKDIWLRASIFDAALGNPRNEAALKQYNPTYAIAHAKGSYLTDLQKTTYWVASAGFEGMRGNLERATPFVEILKSKNLSLGFETVAFHPKAEHNWYWYDTFISQFLFKIFNSS